MARQERVERKSYDRTEDPPVYIPAPTAIVGGGMADLLDDIDSVLEENAEEFVKGYVQKGGE